MARVKARVMVMVRVRVRVRVRIAHYQLAELGEVQGANLTLTLTLTKPEPEPYTYQLAELGQVHRVGRGHVVPSKGRRTGDTGSDMYGHVAR